MRRSPARVKTLPLLLLLVLLPSAAPAAPAAGANLCHASENDYFSCATGRRAGVSLCGSLPASLQYRYGTRTRLQLQFPDQATQGARELRFAHYSRFQVDRAEVSFTRAGVDYTVFDYTENDHRRAGVNVIASDGVEHPVRCIGAIHGALAPLGKDLPCDTDSALNGGRCP